MSGSTPPGIPGSESDQQTSEDKKDQTFERKEITPVEKVSRKQV